MNNLKDYSERLLEGLLFVAIFLMPFWIITIGREQWRITTKRIVIAILVIGSFVIELWVITKPGANLITSILGNVVNGLWYILVLLAAYKTWKG